MHDPGPRWPGISTRRLVEVVDVAPGRTRFHLAQLVGQPDGVTREEVVADHLVDLLRIEYGRLVWRGAVRVGVDKLGRVAYQKWLLGKGRVDALVHLVAGQLGLAVLVEELTEVVDIPEVS